MFTSFASFINICTVCFIYLVCDFLGEKIASVLGISTPKYQYAIDEYYRMKKEVCTFLHPLNRIQILVFAPLKRIKY